DNGRIFGPALIVAVELEKRRARYPRVIVDEEVVMFGNGAEEPVGKIFGRLVRSSDDGLIMVNVLRRVRIVADAEAEPSSTWIARMQSRRAWLAAETARVAGEPADLEKVEWFSRYFE